MKCIYCEGSFVQPFSLQSFLFQKKEVCCEQCMNMFEKIEGPICKKCGRSVKNVEYCDDCISMKGQSLSYNRSIFHYTEEMKEWINRYKFYGDVTLSKMFIKDLRECYEKYFNHIKMIVPIPLSEERLLERGFNQVEILANEAGFQLNVCLKRIHSEKQSKLSKIERLNRKQVFSYFADEKIKNEPILILDDVYTTGKTVRDAATILLQSGASEVFSLTLVRA